MAFYQIKPKTITSSGFLDVTGGVAAIDDPFLTYTGAVGNNALQTNDGLWLTFNGVGSIDEPFLYCNFDLPQLRTIPERGYGFLSTANQAQRFRVWLRKNATGGADPSVAIGVSIDGNTILFDSRTTGTAPATSGIVRNASGATVTDGPPNNLNAAVVTDATGQYFDYAWTVDPLLIDTDATTVHLVLFQYNGGGSGQGTPQRRRFEIGAVEWYAQFNDPVPYNPKTTVYFF